MTSISNRMKIRTKQISMTIFTNCYAVGFEKMKERDREFNTYTDAGTLLLGLDLNI